MTTPEPRVQSIRPDREVQTLQRLQYFVGLSGATVGSTGLSMHLVVIPPGGRSEPHLHVGYETGIYVLEGEVLTRWGAALEHETVSRAGEFLFVPPGVPHEAVNLDATAPARAVVARNDPAEQDRVQPFVRGIAMPAARPAASGARERISSGSTFEAQIGYSRAVRQDPWVFVSGTTGFDYSTMTIADDIEAQTEQCLRNIAEALARADATMADVVRVTYVLPDGTQFPRCWPVLQRWFGEVRPAAMMISAGLADPRMRIEIEVTALKRGPATA